jgi:hypothetical protein
MKLVANPPIRIECGFTRCARSPTHKKRAIGTNKSKKKTANKAPIKPHTRARPHPKHREALVRSIQTASAGRCRNFPRAALIGFRGCSSSAVALYLRRRHRPTRLAFASLPGRETRDYTSVRNNTGSTFPIMNCPRPPQISHLMRLLGPNETSPRRRNTPGEHICARRSSFQ